MPWAPGQSGNLAGYNGPRKRRHQEIYDEIKRRGHQSPLITLSEIHTDTNKDPAVRVTAAGLLAPFLHPKLQALPTPRYIATPIDVPDFKTVEDAKSFLAKVPGLIARGELDLDFADSLTKSTVAWLQLQYAEMGIDLKAQAQGMSDTETTIRIEGGLPALPGTNVTMPNLTNGHDTYQMLEQRPNAPTVDAVPNESPPSETNGQGTT